MAEWTDGERRVIDALKRIQAVIDTEEFKDLSRAFTAEHKDTFEVCDENKLIYTDLHEAYVELMERELLSRVVGVDLDELVQNLPDFVARQRFEQDPEGTGRTIEFLLSLTDFAAFKGLMLSAKLGKDDAGTAAPLALHSAEALAAVGKLNAPADLVSHFAELLALAEGSGAEAWRTIAERKSVYTLQATTRAGVRYQRIAMAISLTVPQLIDAMCDIAHPEHARWSEMIDSVEVLRDQRDGRQIDSLARAHVRLPAIIRALKFHPGTMTMRVYIEHDVPRQGCATCLYITWDAERDEPALASPMTLQRVIMLEPRAGGTTQMSFVQRLPAYIPEWVIGLAMDSTFSRAILMSTEKYRAAKLAGGGGG